MSLLEMSFSSAILILAIVVIRALLLHRLPKKTFLVLWAVALCRLLIPFSIPSRLSIYSAADGLKSGLYEAGLSLIRMPIARNQAAITETVLPVPEAAYGSGSPVWAIWLVGLIACALFFLVAHLRCRKEYKTALPVENAFVMHWQQAHPTRRKVQIRQSDRISAPLTYGILWPVILLPKQTDWTDETRLRYILTHEFMHIRRFDTLTLLVMAAALCVHWFNPLVWLMYVLANRDIELSCDEAVVRTLGGNIKTAYALTLIGLEEKKSRLTPLANNFSKNAIEERIVSIMKMKKLPLLTVVLAVILVSGVTVAFATGAAARTDKAQYGNAINMADAVADDEAILYANLYIDKILAHFELSGSETEDIGQTLATAVTNDGNTGLYSYAKAHILDGNTQDDLRIILRYESFEFIPALSVLLKDSGHDTRGQVIAAVYREYAYSIEESHPAEFESMMDNLERWIEK